VPARLSRAANPFKLTSRELQVLTLAARGESVKAMAATLCVHCRTIEFHLQHIRQKIKRPTISAAIFELLFFVR
jgi:DNA-binding NarL/FixJ family response regulator